MKSVKIILYKKEKCFSLICIVIRDYKNIKEIKFCCSSKTIYLLFSFNMSQSQILWVRNSQNCKTLIYNTKSLSKWDRCAPIENGILKLIRHRKHFSKDNIVFNGTNMWLVSSANHPTPHYQSPGACPDEPWNILKSLR